MTNGEEPAPTPGGTGPAGTGAPGAVGSGTPGHRYSDEVARARSTVDELRSEVRAAVERLTGGPAADASEAAEQVARLRTGLEQDLAALRARIPRPAELAPRVRAVLVAVAAVAGLLGVVLPLRARRRARMARDEGARRQAAAIARELARLEDARRDRRERA